MVFLNDNEIKYELVNMLKKLIIFFDEYNIRYSIMSGSMLGCIRHGGFIPWDDDIDIAILRNDYDKLIDILKNNNTEIDVIGFELKNSHFPFLKMINKSIVVSESNTKKNYHLWIDIFPFDNLPLKKNTIYYKYLKLLKSVYMFRRDDIIIDPNNTKFYTIKKLISTVSKLCPLETLLRHYINMCKKYKNQKGTKLVQDLTWGKTPIEKKLFDDLSEYKFENIKVIGFKNYEQYLKTIYGNYLKLPPKDKQKNHGLTAWRIENEK